jgi:hypothetical protein
MFQYIIYRYMIQGQFVARPNVARPNVAFTISDPMLPGQMSPYPNVALASCRLL